MGREEGREEGIPIRAWRFILRTLTHSAMAAPLLSMTFTMVCEGGVLLDLVFYSSCRTSRECLLCDAPRPVRIDVSYL